MIRLVYYFHFSWEINENRNDFTNIEGIYKKMFFSLEKHSKRLFGYTGDII
ncbi:hypothetical protein [Bacillus cereus group sp. IBL03679]|uniref:hypothetical protein n=1 Tax=Bacillus cereus group sp. IBL03679 TaxID=3240095 RepID=UPI003D2F5F4B